MATVTLLAPKILKWESEAFTNDPVDPGGATKDGITLDTWRHVGYDKNRDGEVDVEDLKLITKDDFVQVLKKVYWDRWHADDIHSQSVAELVVDWVWTSGSYGITIPQSLLGLEADGVVGPKTLETLNQQLPAEIHARLIQARKNFTEDIVVKSIEHYKLKNPGWTEQDLQTKTSLKFRQGWLNRINDYKFVS